MGWLKRLKRRIFGYGEDEVLAIVENILENTYDAEVVQNALDAIDEFDCGAPNVDKGLSNKIRKELKEMLRRDEYIDKARFRYWQKVLRGENDGN